MSRPNPLPFLLILAILSPLLLAGGCSRGPRSPDIVIVVLDTVRRDATGLVEHPRPWDAGGSLTPNLDRLSGEGTAFTNAWSAATWTVPSHATLFTGLLPSQHHCTFARPQFDPDLTTLADRLGEAGYETVAFYSNPWLSDRVTGLLDGFQQRRESDIGGLGRMETMWGDQGGRQILGDMRSWLRDRDDDRPALVFVNFLEAHLPYDPPPERRREVLSDLPAEDGVSIAWGHRYNAGLMGADEVDWPRIRRLYGADVWAADRFLGRLRDLLEEAGLWDAAAVAVVSDHGENLGENGLFEHQFSIQETLLAVPLVVRSPGGVAPSRRDDPVMVGDLFPTVLEWAGLDVPPATPIARSLLGAPAPPERPLVAQYAGPSRGLLGLLEGMNPHLDTTLLARPLRGVRVGDLRLTEAADGEIALHDLSVDPGQHHDLSAARPEVVTRLRAILDAVPTGVAADSSAARELDESTRRQLESLGYVH